VIEPVTQLIAKSIQGVADNTVVIRTGTALSGTNRTTGVITVALDNDPSGVPISAISVAGLVQIGARVVMLAYPPRGLVVLGQIGGVPNLQTMVNVEPTNQPSYTLATLTAGTPVNGFVFTAPTSGQILLEVSPYLNVTGFGGRARVAGLIKTGNVIGSGTTVWNGDGDQGPLCLFENQDSTGATRWTSSSSGMTLVTGLIPNQVYNATSYYRLETAGAFSMVIHSRRITGLLVA
jgi:hypothetical protein